tara:strand:- start:778 stop:951 length:174 start_codon:yes stop_codon:yes gene_type:complete
MKFKVGDLVKSKSGHIHIYLGDGVWKGWGLFANVLGGVIGQLQKSDVEVINASRRFS